MPRDTVLARISARRVCRDCGTNYTATGTERQPWICEVCGGDVMQRDDDTPDAVNRRLDLYETQTAPLIEFYEGQGRLAVVDGVGHPDDVFRRLTDRGRRGQGLIVAADQRDVSERPFRPPTVSEEPCRRAAHLARSQALVLDPRAASIDPRSVRRPAVSFVRAQPPR